MELHTQKTAIRYSINFLRASIPSIEKTLTELSADDTARPQLERLLLEQQEDLATFEALADTYFL